MMNPRTSLFAKILGWFFLNLAVVAVVLIALLTLRSPLDLSALYIRPALDRMRTIGNLIAYDLNLNPTEKWDEVLARYAKIHQIDFVLIVTNDLWYASKRFSLPPQVLGMVAHRGQPGLPLEFRPPDPPHDDRSTNRVTLLPAEEKELWDGVRLPPKPPLPGQRPLQKPRLMIRTQDPTRYWVGSWIILRTDRAQGQSPAFLTAVSDSMTGHGFFFDPLPWLILPIGIFLISLVLWMPLVRHITRPLGRMTRAAEQIAAGRFDVVISETRVDEIGRLARTINHMTARLRGLIFGQKRFLGDVAHELGSPIARIQLGLGIIEQRLPESIKPYLADVLEDVREMADLVHELLSFSRADLQGSRVNVSPIALLPVVERVVQRESACAADILTHLAPDLQVMADPELLYRALANLLRNAIKYAAPAGPIVIEALRDKQMVVIEVRDAGPGVAPDQLEQIFEPFFRTEVSRDRASGGVGLGLAIVKTCIEACKGSVYARNLTPQGLAVTITLRSGKGQ